MSSRRPAIVATARGNHRDGYRGVVVRWPDASRYGRVGEPTTDVWVCESRHRYTRTARACAEREVRRLARLDPRVLVPPSFPR
jgi:hypothetical protein